MCCYGVLLHNNVFLIFPGEANQGQDKHTDISKEDATSTKEVSSGQTCTDLSDKDDSGDEYLDDPDEMEEDESEDEKKTSQKMLKSNQVIFSKVVELFADTTKNGCRHCDKVFEKYRLLRYKIITILSFRQDMIVFKNNKITIVFS